MRLRADVDQGPEVGVDRDQNAAFVGGPAEQRHIARIATQGSHVQHVMPLAAQPVRQPATGAAVDQEPQADVTRTASMLSSAIAACA